MNIALLNQKTFLPYRYILNTPLKTLDVDAAEKEKSVNKYLHVKLKGILNLWITRNDTKPEIKSV